MSTEPNLQDNDDVSNEEVNSTSEQRQQIDIDDEDEDDNSIEAIYTENKLIKSAMTESYSEILNSPGDEMLDINIDCEHGIQIEIPKRRTSSLHRNPSSQSSFPHGSIRVDDSNMTHFVADDLVNKIKISSPSTSKDVEDGPPSRLHLQRQFISQFPQIDANALNDIEVEAQYLAANIDGITENLANLLHSISSITADNVDVYKNAVTKLTDCMDGNIKVMYTIMAKTEEISNRLKNTEKLAARIRDIRKLVDAMDSAL